MTTAIREIATLAVQYEGTPQSEALLWAIYVLHRAQRPWLTVEMIIDRTPQPVPRNTTCIHGHVGWMKERTGKEQGHFYCMECARLRNGLYRARHGIGKRVA